MPRRAAAVFVSVRPCLALPSLVGDAKPVCWRVQLSHVKRQMDASRPTASSAPQKLEEGLRLASPLNETFR